MRPTNPRLLLRALSTNSATTRKTTAIPYCVTYSLPRLTTRYSRRVGDATMNCWTCSTCSSTRTSRKFPVEIFAFLYSFVSSR